MLQHALQQTLLVPCTQMARSLVMLPALMVSSTASSSRVQKVVSASLSSSLALNARPRVLHQCIL